MAAAFGGGSLDKDASHPQQGLDQANAVAVDSKGNVVVAGSFHGHAFLGHTWIDSTDDESDIFITSFTPTGLIRWQKALQGPGEDTAWGIAIDGQDNVYVVGTIRQSADLGAGTSAQAPNTQNAFIASLTSTGTARWHRVLTGTQSTSGLAVDVDGQGNVYATGHFGGTLSALTQASSASLSINLGAHGNQDAFVMKLDAAGQKLSWSSALGGGSYDVGRALTVDRASGKVYITGIFSGTADFSGSGSGTSSAQGKSLGGTDVFVACLDGNGAFMWRETFGSA